MGWVWSGVWEARGVLGKHGTRHGPDRIDHLLELQRDQRFDPPMGGKGVFMNLHGMTWLWWGVLVGSSKFLATFDRGVFRILRAAVFL